MVGVQFKKTIVVNNNIEKRLINEKLNPSFVSMSEKTKIDNIRKNFQSIPKMNVINENR